MIAWILIATLSTATPPRTVLVLPFESEGNIPGDAASLLHFHLVHKLQVGRHTRGGIQPELDRRPAPACRGRGRGRAAFPVDRARREGSRAVAFIYIHRTKIQSFGPLSIRAGPW